MDKLTPEQIYHALQNLWTNPSNAFERQHGYFKAEDTRAISGFQEHGAEIQQPGKTLTEVRIKFK